MYVYGTRLRPPGIGCLPRNGLKKVRFEEFDHGGRHYWGAGYYDRELTEEETDGYELDFIEKKEGN